MGLPDTPGSASLGGLTGGSLVSSTSSALSGLAGGFTGPSATNSLLNSPPVSSVSVPSSIPYPQFSGKVQFPTSTADPYSNVRRKIEA